MSLVCLGLSAHGATAFKRSLTQKQNKYLKDGVFTGGEAGQGASLLNVRRAFSPKLGLERVIVDMGDATGEAKVDGPMGYFQVAMDSTRNRVIVDLAQLRVSKVTESRLKELFKKSSFVKNVALTLDPEDQTATLVMDLSKPARLEAFRLNAKGRAPRIVMDLIPLGAAKAKL